MVPFMLLVARRVGLATSIRARSASSSVLPAGALEALRGDIGVARQKTLVVDEKRGTTFISEPSDVYATPMMIWDMEWHVRDLVLERLPAEYDSVGVHVAFDHSAATPIGSAVTVETTFQQVHHKPKITLIEAETVIRDQVGELGRGVHRRAVVRKADVARRIASRQASLQQVE